MSRPLAFGLIVVSLAFPFVACGGDEDSTANPPASSSGGSSGSSGQSGAGTTSQGGAGTTAQGGAGQAGTASGAAGSVSGAAGTLALGGSSGAAGSGGGAAGSTAGGAGTGGAGAGGTTGGSAGAGGGSAGTFSGGPYCGATKEQLPSISKCDDPAPSECAKAMCKVTTPDDCKQVLLDCYADAGCNKAVSCGAVCRAQDPSANTTTVCGGLAGSGIGKALAYKSCAGKLTACGGDGSSDP